MYGIRNGIDQDIWDPSVDEFLPVQVRPHPCNSLVLSNSWFWTSKTTIRAGFRCASVRFALVFPDS
jgi:glycogen synthase